MLEFRSDVYFVIQSHPKPLLGMLPKIESLHNEYHKALSACDLENMSSDFCSYTVCIFKNGQFIDRAGDPLGYREYARR